MVLDPEPRGERGVGGGWGRRGWGARRLTTETKQAFKTTEFWVFAAVLTALMIASWVIGDDEGGAGDDIFRADEAWRYATFLTIGYLISRGLAKAGSREPYWEGGTNQEREGAGGLGARAGAMGGGQAGGTGGQTGAMGGQPVGARRAGGTDEY